MKFFIGVLLAVAVNYYMPVSARTLVDARNIVADASEKSPPPYQHGSGFEVLTSGGSAKISRVLIYRSIEQTIKTNLKKSPTTARFSAVIRIESGYPVIKNLKPVPDPESLYYAEEAVWDVPAQSLEQIREMPYTFELSGSASSSGRIESVCFYLIPEYIVKNYSLSQITPAEISSADNLKAIPVRNLDSALLWSLRKERYDFFKVHDSQTSRENILKFRDHLCKTYDSLFEKKEAAQK
jgi:hypothetical protein